MKKIVTVVLWTLIALAAAPSWAVQVAGVNVADKAAVAGWPELVLNGAGIRKKFVVQVYVGALYTAAKTTDANAVINDSKARRMQMHLLRDLSADQLITALNEGLTANHTKDELAKLDAQITEFNTIMKSVGSAKKGDTIAIDFVPGTGTRVAVNGQDKGTVKGDDFSRALLKVWLGPKPVDAGLKKSILGG